MSVSVIIDDCFRCEKTACEFGYVVTYDGVGEPTEGNSHVGHCSQIALFTRKSGCAIQAGDKDSTEPYQLVCQDIASDYHKTCTDSVLEPSKNNLIKSPLKYGK